MPELVRSTESTESPDRRAEISARFFAFQTSHPHARQSELLAHLADLQLTQEERQHVLNLRAELSRQYWTARKVINRVHSLSAIELKQTQQPTTEAVHELSGRVLFRMITKHEPTGEICLIDQGNACCLEVSNQADAEALGLSSQGKTKQHFLSIDEPHSEIHVKAFLLTVVWNNQPETQRHELAHNQHRAYALKKEMRHVWGGLQTKDPYFTYYDYGNTTIDLISSYKRGERSATSLRRSYTRTTNRMMPEFLAQAKDEILADFMATHTFDFYRTIQLTEYTRITPDIARYYNDHSYVFWSDILIAKSEPEHPIIEELYLNLVHRYNRRLGQSMLLTTAFLTALREQPPPDTDYTAWLLALLREHPFEQWPSAIKQTKFYQEREGIILETSQVNEAQLLLTERMQRLQANQDQLIAELTTLQVSAEQLDKQLQPSLIQILPRIPDENPDESEVLEQYWQLETWEHELETIIHTCYETIAQIMEEQWSFDGEPTTEQYQTQLLSYKKAKKLAQTLSKTYTDVQLHISQFQAKNVGENNQT